MAETTQVNLEVGDTVIDSEDPEPDLLIVIRNREEVTISDWTYKIDGETISVNGENPGYKSEENVILTTYTHKLDAEWPKWREAQPSCWFSEISSSKIPIYGFPEGRLTAVAPGELQQWMTLLAKKLKTAGWTVSHELGSLKVSKGKESYRILSNGEINGEGDFNSPLANVVAGFIDH